MEILILEISIFVQTEIAYNVLCHQHSFLHFRKTRLKICLAGKKKLFQRFFRDKGIAEETFFLHEQQLAI